MRVLLALSFFAVAATAFRPDVVQQKRPATELAAVSRRELLAAAAAVLTIPAASANALSHGMQNREGSHTHGSTWFFDENIDKVREESQMPTGGKLDLNNAAVVRNNENDGKKNTERRNRVRIRIFWAETSHPSFGFFFLLLLSHSFIHSFSHSFIHSINSPNSRSCPECTPAWRD
jgi:hypothetical protein